MSSPKTILVLGGTRSGKSEYAESLVADAHRVTYVATAAPWTDGDPDTSDAGLTADGGTDPEWSARLTAHRERRPATWHTEETGKAPEQLASLIEAAGPDDTLLVDDLGGWLAALLDSSRDVADASSDAPVAAATYVIDAVAALASALAATDARVVLVSPEVGMTVVPATRLGRTFTDAMGSTNRAIADACDAVTFVVAGQPLTLRGGPSPADTVAPGQSDAAGATVPMATAGATATDSAEPTAAEPTAATPTPSRRTAGAAAAGAATAADADVATAGSATGANAGDATAAAAGAATAADAGVATAGSATGVTAGDATAGSATAPATTRRTAGAASAGAAATAAVARIASPADEADDAEEIEDLRIGMSLPLPDDDAATVATARAERLPVPGAGLRGLSSVVTFVAGATGNPRPTPFRSVRVLVIDGAHDGLIAAGDTAESWAERRTEGANALHVLAATLPETTVEYATAGTGAPLESGDAMTDEERDRLVRRGYRLADAAADRGDDAIVLAAGGPGVDAAATALVAAITRLEVPALLGRVYGPDGTIDDEAWMRRCVTIRDTLRRVRDRVPDGPTMLTTVGGPALALATGVLLGAAARRTPVFIDGPVGAAAALAARDWAAQVRLWCALVDIGGDATVKAAADRLGTTPIFTVGLGLGEGANALALLPLIQAALTVGALGAA